MTRSLSLIHIYADMRSGETFTYREALYAMVTRNANEAAMGLAYRSRYGRVLRCV